MGFSRFFKVACTLCLFSSLTYADGLTSDISKGQVKPIVWEHTIPDMTPAAKNINNVTLHAYIFHESSPETKALSDEDKRQISLLIYRNASQLSPVEVDIHCHQQLLNLGLSVQNITTLQRAMQKANRKETLSNDENEVIKQMIDNLKDDPNVILAPMFTSLPSYLKAHPAIFSDRYLSVVRSASFKAVGLSNSEIATLEKVSDTRPLNNDERESMQKMQLLAQFPIGYEALAPKQVVIFKNAMNTNSKHFTPTAVERINKTPATPPQAPNRPNR